MAAKKKAVMPLSVRADMVCRFEDRGCGHRWKVWATCQKGRYVVSGGKDSCPRCDGPGTLVCPAERL